MGMNGLGECLRELLEAVAHMELAAYRHWALDRIGALIPFDDASWLDGGQQMEGVASDGQVDHWERDLAHNTNLGIRFRRRAPAQFSAEERVVLGLLASQACTAWRTALRFSLLRQMCRGSRAAALIDDSGNIHATHGHLYAALKSSWPQWRDASVPPPLRLPTAAGTTLVAGNRRWTVESSGTLQLVTVRPLGVAGALTPREQAVAAAVLNTGSQQAAAKFLDASIHTVRNTLVRVYSKLGVHNRVELALRVSAE
jgi:DNA-binding CsgD family transcriptional regulator